MDEITTPEEGEELVVVVEDVTDEPERVLEGECIGFKKSGEKCHGMKAAGSEYCQWHGENADKPQGRWAHKQETTTREVEIENELPGTVPGPPKDGNYQPYPFHDGAVSENAAIRVIRMVIPNCPIDPVPEVKQRDGSYRPNPNFTGEQNCQQVYKFNNFGRWDVEKCIELGHDPWHTEFRRPIVEETLDADGYVIDTRIKHKVEKRLNIIQVSDNSRHSNGTEVALALARGCRFLDDFGVASPCEFRNCSQPQRVDTRYGKYCSERHARLVAADKQQKLLPVASDPYSADQANREREDMLENLNIRKGA
jgi:hypothetical protein